MQLPVLKGHIVSLRSFRRSDAASLQRYANDARVARYLPLMPHPYGPEQARQWINFAQRSARQDKAYFFGLEHPELREIVGGIGLKQFFCQDNTAEVGYWLAADFWGKGMATEAVRLITEFSFEKLELHRLFAMTHEKNVGSSKVLEKNGFRREGTMRKAGNIDGQWQDLYTHGLLYEEYRKK
ncbi:MAG: GNAT family N-acetyltransferase [bacterium]|nr:GNAT family N-acetyltransferase [bacterium]